MFNVQDDVIGSLLDNLDPTADLSELFTALENNTFATRAQAADIIAEKLEELEARSVAPRALGKGRGAADLAPQPRHRE